MMTPDERRALDNLRSRGALIRAEAERLMADAKRAGALFPAGMTHVAALQASCCRLRDGANETLLRESAAQVAGDWLMKMEREG